MNLSAAIRATFKELSWIREEIREMEDKDWDWWHGGCFGVANAIAPVIKGIRHSICIYEGTDWELPWATDHAIVKVGNDFYDARGKLTLKFIKKEYFRARRKYDIKPYNAKGVWYADDCYLIDYYAIIRKTLRKHLTS